MGFDFQAAYEELNPADDDYRFYVALAQRIDAQDVIDLGCGTGVLARLLAADGRRVVAIDPDPEMLRVAAGERTDPAVDWRLGASDSVDEASADLIVMCGHVAQLFIAEAEWMRVLRDAHKALRPAGVLAFESRNPTARGWERWTRRRSLQTIGTGRAATDFWHETTQVQLPLVEYDTWTANQSTGERTRTPNRLAFRAQAAIGESLVSAGFEVVDWLGDWNGTGVSDRAPELIVTARKAS